MKKGDVLPELLDILEKHLNSDTKLSPYTIIKKGLLEEILREGRRFIRTYKKE